MDKNSFGKLLDNLGTIGADAWAELRRELERYPFCAPLQVLSLMADKASAAPLWEKRSLPRVSLYCQDVDILHRHLDSMAQPLARPASLDSAASLVDGDAVSSPEAFDVLQAINSYQEVSFKTAPKSVILSKFLENDAGLVPTDNDFEDVSVQELAKKSVAVNETLESETLAVILEKQGKFAQSLAMYEKLLVNNPEKSSIFAVRIAELKSRLETD